MSLHSLEAEQAILGALLEDNGALDLVPGLRPAMFYDPTHAVLFGWMVGQIRDGKPADPVTTAAAHSSMLAQLGGPQYVGTLMIQAGSTEGLPEYAKLVAEYAIRRKLVEACQTAEKAASDDPSRDSAMIAAELESALHQLQEVSAAGAGSPAATAAAGMLQRVRDSMAGQGERMLTFGMPEIDGAVGPIGCEDVIVLGGRTSMGKSAVAQQLAMMVAEQGHGVAFFALEMSRDQMGARLLSALARPNLGALSYSKIYKVGAGLEKLHPNDVQALEVAAKQLEALPMHIDTRGGLRPSDVMAACRRIKRNFARQGAPLGLIVIDHIGEMVPDERCNSDYERASSIARWLKQATKALQVPILACVQINRDAEKTASKKPTRAMLRDSGRIEEIADSILLVHREAYYHERDKPSKLDPEYLAWSDKLEAIRYNLDLICDKARMGRPQSVELWFDPSTTIIRSPETEQ